MNVIAPVMAEAFKYLFAFPCSQFFHPVKLKQVFLLA